MRKFIMSLTTVASLSLAAVPVLGLTQAANAADVQARVAYGDLNLSNPTDAAKFNARIGEAARQICTSKNHRDMPRVFCLQEVRLNIHNQLSKHQRKSLQIAARAERAAKTMELAAQ